MLFDSVSAADLVSDSISENRQVGQAPESTGPSPAGSDAYQILKQDKLHRMDITDSARKRAEAAKQYIENLYSNRSKDLNDRRHRCAFLLLRRSNMLPMMPTKGFV